jgi:hypothetical protein
MRAMNSTNVEKVGAWLIAIPFLAAFILSLSHMQDGAALSMDSLYYLRTAQNILGGDGITQQTFAMSGELLAPMTVWPAGYPLVLAAVMGIGDMLGFSDIGTVRAFNLLALLTSTLLFFLIVNVILPSKIAAVASMLMVLSPSSQIVHVYAWSEVLFIPLSLAGFWCLQLSLKSDDQRVTSIHLLGVVAFFVLSTYVRYVGIAFFAAAMLSIALFQRNAIGLRVRQVVALSTIFVLALLPLFLRNFLASGALSGMDRGAPDTELVQDIWTLLSYCYFEFINLPIGVGAIILVLSFGVAIWLGYRNRHAAELEDPSAIPFAASAIITVTSYAAFLLVSRQVQTIDLDTRMLSVVVPFLWFTFLGVYAYQSQSSNRRLAAIPLFVLIIASAINAYSAHVSIISGWRTAGEPGQVLNMSYPSISSRRFDVLRSISQEFPLSAGSTVITDNSRPIVFQHFFPKAIVRRLPGDVDSDAADLLEKYAADEGLVIIGTSEWWKEITRRFQGKSGFYTIKNYSGDPEWLVMKLPVAAP